MIAFYAVSNLAIFNALNVKEQYYPDTGADLFVRYVNGTMVELVEWVRNTGVFDNVFTINFPVISTKAEGLGRVKLLRALSQGIKYQRFVSRYLNTMVPGKKYDVLLTLHMDSHCVYFADYFHRNNKKLSIEFFEDGTASYLRSRKFIALRPIRMQLGFKAYIAKCFYQMPIRIRLRSVISRVLYIYAPEQYDLKKGFRPKKLEIGKTGREILTQIADAIDPTLRMRYEKRPIYYIANAKSRGEPTYDDAYKILDCIIESVGRDKLIIKTHSSASTENKLGFASQFEKVAYVDRNVYLLEGLLSGITDIENKVIIARATTAMILPKLWFNKEPYIILTLRLFPYYGQYGDPGGDEYIEMLRSMYSDPSRIMVPNTLGDLRIMLMQLRMRVYNERYGTLESVVLEDAMPEWEEMKTQIMEEQAALEPPAVTEDHSKRNRRAAK